MSKNLEAKKDIVESVTGQLQNSGDQKNTSSTVIFNYSQITANQMNELRSKLNESDASLRIVKNSLIKIVLNKLGIPTPDERKEILTGQNAVLIHSGSEFMSLLKDIFAFIKSTEKGAITLGVLNNKIMSQDEFETLSKLPSREELIAQVIGGFVWPIRSFAYTLNGVQSQFVGVLNQIKSKK